MEAWNRWGTCPLRRRHEDAAFLNYVRAAANHVRTRAGDRFRASRSKTGAVSGQRVLPEGANGCGIESHPERCTRGGQPRPPERPARDGPSPTGAAAVVGPTGSGKSTTLACLVDRINRTRKCRIITIEDPVEYSHESVLATVDQRELFADTQSFAAALKFILRQDPDVILVGEMRDFETISAVLTAAETGHLVLATMHSNDAVQAIDRIVDVFQSHQQGQARAQLASSLLGVISQRLLPKKGGGLAPAFEVMVANPAIRNLIREAKMHQARGPWRPVAGMA